MSSSAATGRPAAGIELSREQGLLLEIAARTVRERWPIERVRDDRETEGRGEAAEALEREIAELGWYGIAIAEEHGGAGQGVADLVPLVEPLGRHLVGGPFVATQIAAAALGAAQDTGLQAHWLPRIAEGQPLALALFEGDGSWDLDEPACALRREPDGSLRLVGEKQFVTDLGSAAGLLVSARGEEGPALVVLEHHQLDGVERTPEVVIDLTRRSTTVRFDALAVPGDQAIVGAPALAALRSAQEAAWLLHAAEAWGGLQGVLDGIVDYLRSRRQLGRTIGSYQSLKHPTVDLLIGLERARSLLYHAATVISRPESSAAERETALRMAKAAACEAFADAGDRAIQFHGGVGFTWECDAQLYLRRALWLNAQWGDPLHHRRRLAGLLLA